MANKLFFKQKISYILISKRRKRVNEVKIQCPCGRIIGDPEEYKIVCLKHEMKEIDIFLPK